MVGIGSFGASRPSVGALMAAHTSPRFGLGSRWTPAVPPAVVALAAVGVGLLVARFVGSSASSLPLVTVVCLPAQVGLFVILRRRVVGRSLAFSVAIAGAWLVYFTLRLLVTQFDRGNLNEHAIVMAAGDDAFVWAWVMTTVGLAAFVVGVTLAGAGRRSRKYVPDLNVDTLFWFASVGLAGRVAMVFGGINSGFIENVLSLYLFGFAALGFHSVSQTGLRRRLYLMVGVASSLGVLTSFKEAAIIPVLALAVGMAAGVVGTRSQGQPTQGQPAQGQSLQHGLSSRATAILLGTGLLLFLAIQGNRVAFDEGDSVSLIEAPFVAFTTYDFEAGVTAAPDRTLDTATAQVLKGMSRRFGGVTSIIVLHEQVPSEVGFLGGTSIWQPAMSSVPVASGYFDLDFQVLSLGRYFTQTFIAPDQPDNTSSQAITMLGDLYLNFGNAGIGVGFLLWGMFVGTLDRRFTPTTATRVGAVAYLGHLLIGVERNVAYVGVNTAIRLVVLLLVLRGVARWGSRETAPRRMISGTARA